MFPLGAVLDIGSKILDKVFPDPAAAEQAKLKLLEMQLKVMPLVLMYHSWLSKNIRPMTLIAILSGYFIFAFMSAFGHNTNERYVELLGQWGMLIMSFYFGGRTLEKILAMKEKK